ncbi:MAG: RNA methyltransferase [Caldilineaceae bacterium]|nr:RNA methyltransferase [Caldilineaceae bacterium]
MTATIEITSTENPQIKEARKLQRRRQRYRDRLFLVEGVRLVRDALESGAVIQRLFYAPAMIADNEAAQTLVAQCTAQQVACFACTPDVLNTLTETITPQGIVAVVVMPALALPSPLHFTLILDQVRDPGNAGTLLRTAAAAGVDAVIFGPETVDPYNDKVLRAGMGAHFRLPLRNCPTWSAIQPLLAPEQRCFVAEAGAPLRYDNVDWTQPCALIIGGEAAGASHETTSFAQRVAIPMHSQVESLNAAIAGSIILFEAARQRRTDR